MEAHKQRPVLFGVLIVLVIVVLSGLIYLLFYREIPQEPLVDPVSTLSQQEYERRLMLASEPVPFADISPAEYQARLERASRPVPTVPSSTKQSSQKSSIREI